MKEGSPQTPDFFATTHRVLQRSFGRHTKIPLTPLEEKAKAFRDYVRSNASEFDRVIRDQLEQFADAAAASMLARSKRERRDVRVQYTLAQRGLHSYSDPQIEDVMNKSSLFVVLTL